MYLAVIGCVVFILGAAAFPGCPRVTCAPEVVNCRFSRYPSYFADIRAKENGICRLCDACIKPGTPEDSTGCPLMSCPEKLAPGSCYLPHVYNSWVEYRGRRCPTCEANMCDIGFKGL